MKIGFIGQGWIGRHLADNFEERGYKELVRYDRSEEFVKNKERIRGCPIVFVAVPTPSKPQGFDSSVLDAVIPLTGPHACVVIKSTILPDVARRLQRKFPDKVIMHCPEFLTEATAKFDTDSPARNLIGISDTNDSKLYQKAKKVMEILPKAKYEMVCTYEEASLVKYAGNCFFLVKNLFFNLIYDLANSYGGRVNWDLLQNMIIADNRIHSVHTNPIHKGGRGAGGHCLIKDFAALRELCDDKLKQDKLWLSLVSINEAKNKELLRRSKKDLELLKGIYGDNIL